MIVPCVVVVCGGRKYDDWATMAHHLSVLRPTEIASGDAQGADDMAERWAYLNDIPHRKYRADWKTHGRAGGPIRNKEMLVKEQPHVVLALPGGRGTADCVRQAKGMGIKVVEVPLP